MKVADLYAEYETYTKVLTETGRTLAIGAAAIGWFFRSAEFTFPAAILLSVLFVALYFILDILQLLVSAVRLKRLANSKEAEILRRKGNIYEEQITKPLSFTRIPYLLFLLKFPCLLFAYMSLAVEFTLRLIRP